MTGALLIIQYVIESALAVVVLIGLGLTIRAYFREVRE
jgi:hypothetical protein